MLQSSSNQIDKCFGKLNGLSSDESHRKKLTILLLLVDVVYAWAVRVYYIVICERYKNTLVDNLLVVRLQSNWLVQYKR